VVLVAADEAEADVGLGCLIMEESEACDPEEALKIESEEEEAEAEAEAEELETAAEPEEASPEEDKEHTAWYRIDQALDAEAPAESKHEEASSPSGSPRIEGIKADGKGYKGHVGIHLKDALAGDERAGVMKTLFEKGSSTNLNSTLTPTLTPALTPTMTQNSARHLTCYLFQVINMLDLRASSPLPLSPLKKRGRKAPKQAPK